MTTIFDVCVWVRLISFMLQNERFQYSPTGLQWARSRDWPDLRWPTCKIWDKNVVPTTQGLATFRKFHLPENDCLYHWQRCELAIFCDPADTYDAISQWSDLTWKWKKIHNGRHDWGVSLAKFQLSIANGAGAIARKPSGEWGGTNHPLSRPG